MVYGINAAGIWKGGRTDDLSPVLGVPHESSALSFEGL